VALLAAKYTLVNSCDIEYQGRKTGKEFLKQNGRVSM